VVWQGCLLPEAPYADDEKSMLGLGANPQPSKLVVNDECKGLPEDLVSPVIDAMKHSFFPNLTGG
jgi:hypothetical protein